MNLVLGGVNPGTILESWELGVRDSILTSQMVAELAPLSTSVNKVIT